MGVEFDGTKTNLLKFDSTILPLKPKGYNDLFVFNEKYIDKKIKIEDEGLGAIILFGDQVDVDAEIQKLTDLCSKESTQLEDLQDKNNDYNDKNNPISPQYHYDRIINKLKSDDGWSERDRALKGNKTKSKVDSSIVNELFKLSVTESLKNLQENFHDTKELLEKISDSSISFPNQIEQVTFDNILFIIRNNGQTQVEAARETFSNDEVILSNLVSVSFGKVTYLAFSYAT